jgi:hypothetical protein
MKVYTFYTDSHREIFEIFEKNFPYEENIELNTRWLPQECHTGSYMGDGWMSTMRRKVQYILDSLEETKEGDWFVHSDCDILLFKNWTTILEKNKDTLDIIVQSDFTELCAGFFFCKSNSKTKDLWQNVFNNITEHYNDQTAMNHYIKNTKNLKAGVLPKTFFTYGLLGKGRWEGQEFEIPNIQDVKMFHANWAAGIDKKKALLENCLKQKNGN